MSSKEVEEIATKGEEETEEKKATTTASKSTASPAEASSSTVVGDDESEAATAIIPTSSSTVVDSSRKESESTTTSLKKEGMSGMRDDTTKDNAISPNTKPSTNESQTTIANHVSSGQEAKGPSSPPPTEDTKEDGADHQGGGESSEASPNQKKRAAEGPPPGLPTQPIKAARTAYFIFAAEKREEIKKEHPGEPVGVIARITGQLWSALTDEEKAVYQGKAAEERERVAQEIAKYNLDAIHLGGAGTNAPTKDPLALEIPQARLKKIVKLDPEVKGVSREAMLLLGKAAELFTAKLGVEAVKVASLQNRRKLLPDDVAQICQTREQFLFLKDDVKDLLKEQHLEKKASAANKAATASEANASAASNSKPLTAYFAAKS